MCREPLQDELLKDGVTGPGANLDREVGEDEAYPPIRADSRDSTALPGLSPCGNLSEIIPITVPTSGPK